MMFQTNSKVSLTCFRHLLYFLIFSATIGAFLLLAPIWQEDFLPSSVANSQQPQSNKNTKQSTYSQSIHHNNMQNWHGITSEDVAHSKNTFQKKPRDEWKYLNPNQTRDIHPSFEKKEKYDKELFKQYLNRLTETQNNISNNENLFQALTLSIIVVTRNDKYLGDSIGRLYNLFQQIGLYNWHYYDHFSKNSIELIIVEWNNDETASNLADLALFSQFKDKVNIKIRWLNVNKSLHNDIIRYRFNDERGASDSLKKNGLSWQDYANNCHLLEFIGKNIGARRANGDLLLFTTSDMIPQYRLLKYLNYHLNNINFIPNVLYLSQRPDIDMNKYGKLDLKYKKILSKVKYHNDDNINCPCDLPTDLHRSNFLQGGDVIDLQNKERDIRRGRRRRLLLAMDNAINVINVSNNISINRDNFGNYYNTDQSGWYNNSEQRLTSHDLKKTSRNMIEFEDNSKKKDKKEKKEIKNENNDNICWFNIWDIHKYCIGDFQMLFKNDFFKVYGFLEIAQIVHIDSEFCHRLHLIYKFALVQLNDECVVYHQWHPRNGKHQAMMHDYTSFHGCNSIYEDSNPLNKYQTQYLWSMLPYTIMKNETLLRWERAKRLTNLTAPQNKRLSKNARTEISDRGKVSRKLLSAKMEPIETVRKEKWFVFAGKKEDDLWLTDNAKFIAKNDWGFPQLDIPETVWEPT